MINYDYLILTVQSWGTPIGTNSRDIARALARKSRVLLIDPPLDWVSTLRRSNQKADSQRDGLRQSGGKRLVEVEPNIWVFYPRVVLTSINWLPDNALFDWLNQRNNVRLAQDIQWALRQLNMNDYVLFNDTEMFRGFYLKELLNPALYVYYIRDNTLAVDYWRRHGERLEPMLIQKSDLTVANSAYLTSMAARYSANAVDIGQGCDLSQFMADAPYEEPADLVAIPYPRIGYTGAIISMRLDIALLESVARQRPDWHLVLVGPEDDAFRASRLHQLPNVHFLGTKPIDDVPAYVRAFDVLINPQVVNPITIGNYPRKVDEYLAMGKPVVAVRTEAMAMFRDHVLLADSPTQFVDCVERALTNQMPSSAEQRIRFAQGHSWENCVDAIHQAIEQTTNATSGSPVTA
ncbi:glycosyltransferase [Spirosoma arcticum]